MVDEREPQVTRTMLDRGMTRMLTGGITADTLRAAYITMRMLEPLEMSGDALSARVTTLETRLSRLETAVRTTMAGLSDILSGYGD